MARKIVIAIAVTVTCTIGGIAIYVSDNVKGNTCSLISFIKPPPSPLAPIPQPPKPKPGPENSHYKNRKQSPEQERLAIKKLLENVRVAYDNKDPRLMASYFINAIDAKAAIKMWDRPRIPAEIKFEFDEPFVGSMDKNFMTVEIRILQDNGGTLKPHAVRKIEFEKRDDEWKIASGNLFQ